MFIKPVLGEKTKLFLVGGNRRLEQMEKVIEKGQVDAISMCRPFIREPYLVRQFREGKTTQAACISCNRCLGAIPNDMPVKCYAGGLPKKK